MTGFKEAGVANIDTEKRCWVLKIISKTMKTIKLSHISNHYIKKQTCLRDTYKLISQRWFLLMNVGLYWMGIMAELKIGNSQPRSLRKQCGNILDDKIMGHFRTRDDFMSDVKTFCNLLNKTLSLMQITMFFSCKAMFL